MKPPLIIVKLGGSLITDKSRKFNLNTEVVKRLGRELTEAIRESRVDLILVHGGGSYAHPVAKEYSASDGLRGKGGLKGFVETSKVVRMLCLDVLSNLMEGGLMAVSIPASSIFTTRSGKISTCNLEPMLSALRLGLVPITSGDVIFDRDLGFTVLSGDEISSYLAIRLRAKRLIFAMNVDGVYVRDWATGGIKVAEEFSHKMMIEPIGGEVEDVTGGIARKIEEGFAAAEAGVEVLFISGLAEGRLKNAVLGLPVPGTRLKP